MYPRAFAYYRAGSLQEASSMVTELGPKAKLLAGGQSLIPLMKLRLANPTALVDLGYIPGLNYIKTGDRSVEIGPLSRHAEIERSEAAQRIPSLHDCASGIADVQVRNWGTMAGSIAEADPTGDWAPVLLTLQCEVHCLGPAGKRSLPMSQFIQDAFTTALLPGEVIEQVTISIPPPHSGGAYIAFKRCAPVYASASAAVQLSLEDGVCHDAVIVLGAVGLTPVVAKEAAEALRDNTIDERIIEQVAEAAAALADPTSDTRGSAGYKRALVRKLVKEAMQVARQRARGESVEVMHHYA